MDNFEQEIKEIIEQHLPKQMGDTLRERLNTLESVEANLAELKERFNDREEALIECQKKNRELEKQLTAITAERDSFIQSEVQLTKRENDVRFVEQERKCAEDMLFEFKGMMSLIFQNTVIRKKVLENSNKNNNPSGYYDDRGNQVCNTSENKDVTEETRESSE